jgi:hypothetical protein
MGTFFDKIEGFPTVYLMGTSPSHRLEICDVATMFFQCATQGNCMGHFEEIPGFLTVYPIRTLLSHH